MAGEGGPGGSSSDADLEAAVVRTLTQLFADEDAWRVAWDDLCQHVGGSSSDEALGGSSSDEALRLARVMNTSSFLRLRYRVGVDGYVYLTTYCN